MTRNLRAALVIGIFAIPFIPLIGSNGLVFPFITGKAFAFRIIVEILVGIWLLLMISDGRYRPRFSGLVISVLAFVGVIAVADIFGVDRYRSFWSDFERMDGLVHLIHIAFYFLIAATVLSTKSMWDRFLNTTIGVSAALSLVALLQMAGSAKIYTDAGRLDSTIGNAAYFGTYLLLHIFLILFMLLRGQGRRSAYVYGSIASLHIIILYFTATRSAMLGLVGGLLVALVLIVLFERERRLVRNIAIVGVAGIMLVIACFIAMRDLPIVQQHPILGRFTEISFAQAKEQHRFYLWSIAIKGFMERPLLGWGQENFKIVFFKHYHPALYGSEAVSDKPHNVVLEWLVAGGVLGLAAYLSIYLAALYSIWLNKRSPWSVLEKSVLTGFLAGYFINGLFLFDNISSHIVFFGFLAYIHSRTLPEYEPQKIPNSLRKKLDQEARDRLKRDLVPAAVLVVLLIYFFNAKGIAAASSVARALVSRTSNPEESLDHFQKALERGSFGHQKIRQEAALSAIKIEDEPHISGETKRNYFDFARSEMEKQARKLPSDAHDQYILGSLLYAYGRYDDALLYLERARELSPKKQLILLRLAEALRAAEEHERAHQVSKEAYELEPAYAAARDAYALSAILAQDHPTASRLLIERYGSDTPFDHSVLKAYAESEQYEKIIETYKKRIIQAPDDMQSRASLSIAYAKIGDRRAAIAVLEEAIRYDSSFAPLGEKWIREIQAGEMPR